MSTALLVIDVQAGMMPYIAHSEELLQRISELLRRARAAGTPVIYVQHEENQGLVRGTPDWEIHAAVAPQAGDPVIHKRAADSFHETNLEDELQQRGIGHLIMTGCQTDYCVNATFRSAVAKGYDVTLVKDAHSTEDSETMKADQIIAQHNDLFSGFATENDKVHMRSAREVTF